MSGNLLIHETSPYLLQHRDNPVHWRPWGTAAFTEARASRKPVLLSIGYAACHWCHVMAHESFEDAATADLMNARFVNIKVDREERPEIDKTYMDALQAFGDRGGWPLTMFLTAEGKPFWGGTYFPPEPRFGKPGFKQVLLQIANVYRDAPDKIAENIDSIARRVKKHEPPPLGEISIAHIDDAAQRLLPAMDKDNGGMRGAPKFPQAGLLELLWRAGKRDRDARMTDAVVHTLGRICQGGIYDHLGGGFSRYSTDERWHVPHFEKMLCDNAQLLRLLTWAWQDTRLPLFKQRVEETVGWLTREMTTDGAFAASLDADSEGVEGKFYVWTLDELVDVLGESGAALFADVYNATAQGNWERANVLHRLDAPRVAREADETRLKALRETLLAAREKRVRPAIDDKALADWNGMTIEALAGAGTAFAQPAWITLAERTYAWIAANMTRGDRVGHSARLGRATFPGIASDAAHMIAAAISLYEATGRANYLADAARMTRALDARHWDDAKAYYLAADDADDLFERPSGGRDGATPNANSVMAANLVRLGLLTGASEWLDKANCLFKIFGPVTMHAPFEHAALLNAFDLAQGATEVVIVGPPDAARDIAAGALAQCLPNLVILRASPADALTPGHPAYGRPAVDGKPTAYVCRAGVCSLPATSAAALEHLLARTR